jgi:hypothetical protein
MYNNVKLPHTFSTILLFRAALGHNFFKHAVHASKYIPTNCIFFLIRETKYVKVNLFTCLCGYLYT